ncbi:cadherin-like protein 26 isoform X2 [Hypomesus transpacificus]|uniref:cadherin-like protein 26 isoform X2 n=1 Tax=Hypomesus transpacificus TaxID=137520 RepID=UPI001F076615|nr:cadherin-like protein 26 isoform X2 [Hypomesus transpacificus]
MVPYHTCRVKRRPDKGLWDVVTTGDVPAIRQMVVTVEDVNEPPFFTPDVKNITVDENMPCVGILSASPPETLVRKKRHWIIDSFQITEEYPGPFPYLLGKIKVEKNVSIGFNLQGQGVTEDPKETLTIDTHTGEIWVNKKIDYEKHQKLMVTFEAKNLQNNVVDTRLGVEVEVMDINDNAPRFEKETYTVNLKESASQNTFLTGVLASDKDKYMTNNGTLDLRIVSVSPLPIDLEFYIEQSGPGNHRVGIIQFKGCLDHEKAEKYTILVEAKDRGEKVQLSSISTVIINIEDGNNHLPVFTGQTGSGRVKEGDEKVPVLRMQVSDQDTPGTDAWRAVYTIHGDKGNHFRITTDPQSNEGVLFVDRALDYEKGSLRNLSVSVTNMVPYHTCQVKGRPDKGLWDVVTTGDVPAIRQVVVTVEDVNEPPFFTPDVKNITVDENMPVGLSLEVFTAKDLDHNYDNTLLYMKGEDLNEWVKVDSKSGTITTAKILDREAPNIINGHYKVTLYAVDSGKPPMTGTGTLNIHLNDQNDNMPFLERTSMDMCLSDQASVTNITALDLDGDPYSGPFHFQLEGDVKDKWKLEPNNGYTVSLVKEATVHAGYHELKLRVFDLQGQQAVHNLSVTVCECSQIQHCDLRSATQLGGGTAIGILLALLLLGVLLLALMLSCEGEMRPILEESSGNIMKSYIETPGSDCVVPLLPLQIPAITAVTQDNYEKRTAAGAELGSQSSNLLRDSVSRPGLGRQQGSFHWVQSTTLNQSMSVRSKYWSEDSYLDTYDALLPVLHKKTYRLQMQGNELGDYSPHPYAEEGDPETSSQLDAISIPESPFNTDMLLHLGPRFNTLASLCTTKLNSS